jgi:mono/diheme cytochrome c family protein
LNYRWFGCAGFAIADCEEGELMSGYVTSACAMAIAALLMVVPSDAFGEGSADQAKAAYLRYCSACHGEGGKGDGVVSGFMRPQPTDLTVLAKKNNGQLPSGHLMRVIDGRETVRAHGDPNMPVWGEILKEEAGASIAKEAVVRGKLVLIVDYLASIQQK